MRTRKFVIAALVVAAGISVGGCAACDLVVGHTLTASPVSPEVGQEVTLTPDYRLTQQGHYDGSLWDLDGDGRFELVGRRKTPVNRAYDQAGTVRVTHLVAAERGRYWADDSITSVDLVVRAPSAENQPPFAEFTISPQPVELERPVIFDASASNDPDGQIVRYQWDLDGNGTWDIDNGSNPVFEYQQGYIEDTRVVLRVTNSEGLTDEVEHTVLTQPPPPAPPGPRIARRLAQPGSSFSLSPDGKTVGEGPVYVNGDQLILTEVRAKGRVPAGLFPRKLRKGKRDARVAGIFDVSIDTVGGDGSASGFALFSFPGGGRACASFVIDVPATGKPGGTLAVIGGKGGDADRLRGEGTATGAFGPNGGTIEGNASFRLGAERRFPLAKSGCAPLR
jgi:hypothetical protein